LSPKGAIFPTLRQSDQDFSTPAVLPRDHQLAAGSLIEPRNMTGETFIGISSVPRILRGVVNGYLEQSGVRIRPHLEIDNFAMATSLVGSTKGIALLPASIDGYLPPSVVSRSLAGEQPAIDLTLAFHKANRSPVLEKFLAMFGDLSAQIWARGSPSAARF
jgi:LysR family hca operon transcriptional activator